MLRLTAALSVLALSLPVTLHAAEDAKAANCAATAEIVSLAVQQRGAGRSKPDTTGFLTSDAAEIDDKYDQTIPVLVDWVFALDAAVLEQDVAGSFEESCLAYEG